MRCLLVKNIMLLAVMTSLPGLSSAQVDGWRYEYLNLPPAAGDIRVLNGIYHASAHGITSVFDTTLRQWNPSSVDLGALRLWSTQPSGVNIVQRGNDIVRYDAHDASISTRDNVYYQFEHADSILCSFSTKFDQPSTSFLSIATWFTWPSRDTLRIDTVVMSAVYGDVVPCADSTALVFAERNVIRYRYGGQPQVVELPDTVNVHRRSVYLGKEQTHIVVLGRNSLLFSSDHGRSWQSVLSADRDNIRSFSATNDPNVILVVLDSMLTRLHVSTNQRDTLLTSACCGSTMMVDHGPNGAIVALLDTVMFIEDGTNDKSLIHSGLPQRSLVDLIAVRDGVAGTGDVEVLHHPSLGQWSTPDVDRRWLNIDPYRNPMIFRGGRDLNDLWLTRGTWALRLHPADFMFTAENLLLPQTGCWWNEDVARFTVITNLEGLAGSHQVTWWSGSSPDNILLQKNGLRFLIGFDDSVLVAFGQQGTAWRTINASHSLWEEINMPVVDLGFQPRSQSKGRHGVVVGPRMKAWTHDAGRTWQVDSLPLREAVTLTNNGVLYHVWVDDQNGSEYALVIDKQVDGMRIVVAALPHEIFDTRLNSLNALAYDDNEHRLYIATKHWVGSLAMDPVSVREENHGIHPQPRMPMGTYDIFGRYLGRDLPANAATGCYIVVDDKGEARLVVY